MRAPALGLICAGLVLTGAAAGQARLHSIDAQAGRLAVGSELDAQAHLLEPPRRSSFGSRAELRITSGAARGARVLALAGRGLRWPKGIAIGSELRVRGVVRGRATRPNAGFDFSAYLRRRGIAAQLPLTAVRATGRRRDGIAGALDAMRRRAERAVSAGVPREGSELLRGMVLGQDERIDQATRDDWRASGLAHLLAVSGQNVMLLSALAMPALTLLGLPPRGRAVTLLALIALYVPLAGAGPSLQRAGVMGAAGVVALAASRPSSRSYALLLAAAVTLVLNPRVSGDPGWQLSFVAVLGILWLGPGIRRALGASTTALRAALIDGVAITIAATVATAPLVAYHFGSAPLAALPANLLVLPAVAPAMWSGMVKVALGQAQALGWPLAPVAAAAAQALGPPTGVAVRFIAWVAERFADLPGARPSVPLHGLPALIGAYAGLGALALVARRVLRRRPGAAARWRELPRSARRASAVAGCAGAALLLVAAIAPPAPPGRLTVSFLEVGQGDATLIQHPDGTALLFDGGPPEGGVARLLRRAGVRRLAVVVATHASRDHHGGLAEVLRRYPVSLLLEGGDGTVDPGFRAMLREAERRGVKRLRATAPLVLRAGGLRIRVMSPPPRPPGPAPEDPNRRAVVATVSTGAFDLLLSADAESEALGPLDLPDVEAMKVPHHGSADPGLPDVLERLRPEVAAIEVGENTYGHPAQSTLAALRRAGVPTYRTDRDGTVRVTVAGGHMRVETAH